MIHKMFSVFDQKAHAYLPPFHLHHADLAKRIFADCINSKDHQFGRHPADYTLYEIGEFDDASGKIWSRQSISLGNGVEFVNMDKDGAAAFNADEESALKLA